MDLIITEKEIIREEQFGLDVINMASIKKPKILVKKVIV